MSASRSFKEGIDHEVREPCRRSDPDRTKAGVAGGPARRLNLTGPTAWGLRDVEGDGGSGEVGPQGLRRWSGIRVFGAGKKYEPDACEVTVLGRARVQEARGHDPEICPICSWGGVKSRLRQEAAGGPRRSPPRKSRARGRA